MPELPNGTSARVHADFAMREIEHGINEALTLMRAYKRLRPTERDYLSRRLAGVIGHCEGLRLWLERGAPE